MATSKVLCTAEAAGISTNVATEAEPKRGCGTHVLVRVRLVLVGAVGHRMAFVSANLACRCSAQSAQGD